MTRFSIVGVDIPSLIIKYYPHAVETDFLESQQDELYGTAIELTNEVSRLSEKNHYKYHLFYDPYRIPNKFWLTQNPEFDASPKRCHWDHHEFSTKSIGCPLDYDSRTKSFSIEKCFCSFSCALAYINHKCIFDKRYECSKTLLCQMFMKYNRLSLKDISDYKIPVAPPIDVIDTYQGHLTIKEYRKSFGKILYYPIVNTINTSYRSLVYKEKINELNL